MHRRDDFLRYADRQLGRLIVIGGGPALAVWLCGGVHEGSGAAVAAALWLAVVWLATAPRILPGLLRLEYERDTGEFIVDHLGDQGAEEAADYSADEHTGRLG